MHYQVSRNGQTYGPYTLEDLQRYVASGNVLPTDLAKSEEMPEWIPVSQLLGNQEGAASPTQFANPGYANPGPAYNPAGTYPGGSPAALAASPYSDAPNLHWGLVLLFDILTCSLFMVVWNLIVAAWLKRVQPNATSLYFYLGALVLAVVQIAVSVPNSIHLAMMGPGIHHGWSPVAGSIGLLHWIVRLIARFSQRASLEEHFNGPEPVGLQLNPVMTFFFGGLYFQYHLNRINAIKQAARYGAGRAY